MLVFWAPCGSGEGAGEWGGIWGNGGCPPTCTCMHTHTHTHIYTCIEIANGRRHGGIHVYHVYNMFNMHVHACVRAYVCIHVHACMHGTALQTPISIPTPIHPSAIPRGVDPRNHLKFNNTSTYQDISIPFKDLKSVKNSPPMSGCVVDGWVGGWVG